MNKNLLSFIVSLLQGASWALAALLSIYLFFHTYHYGLLAATILAFFGALIGLFFVAFFELINIQMRKLSETQKQTELLKEILKELRIKN